MSSTDYSEKRLPKQFVKALNVLFDILDERSTGYVHLSDIESRWKGFNVDGLPKGIIESWRSVALPDLRLDFDRFLSGIELSLAQTSRSAAPTTGSVLVNYNNNKNTTPASHTAASSHLDLALKQPLQQHAHVAPVSMVQPHTRESPLFGYGAIENENKASLPKSKQRTFSMPQLPNTTKSNNVNIQTSSNLAANNKNIVDVLKKWQTERMGNVAQTVDPAPLQTEPRASISSMSALVCYSDTEVKKCDDTAVTMTKRRIIKRNDGRRHTVSSGIDFQMIKRMRRLKQEEGILLHGLAMLDKARQWYLEQINLLQERQKYLGTTLPQGSTVDIDQDLNIQAAQISEVNHQLNLLIHSTDKAFSHHMNLASHGSDNDQLARQLQEQSEVIIQLSQQNKQLSREVSQMAETIKKLEQEKTQVIREIFHASSRNRSSDHEESSYI